jgi:phosphoglycolate phosphatase-like HAD superfamily hydrolase
VKDFSVLFWDFDGVIKDSVTVKTSAFRNLFLPYGGELADRVCRHHEAHGGMSRFEKMPVYLQWADQPATPENVRVYCDRFSEATLQAVIQCPWVPGVREYLLANHTRQKCVVVTATPQAEIEQILQALELAHCFTEIHGAPTPKSEAIRTVLLRLQCSPERALMVGDSDTDLAAAEANGVAFMLRQTPLNESLQRRFGGPMFHGLTNE